MSGGGLIRLLAQRLAGGAAKEAETPVLREVLARRLGRASDGSILPVREPEPFSNSLRGSNNDLMDAAGMSPSRPLPDAGSVQGGNATLYRGSNTGGRRGRWMTPDRQAAGDYGQVSSASQDVRGALEISDFGDLEVALGDKAAVLRRMDADNADVWDALEEPSVQAALRENGHRVVRLSDDVSPTGRRHESYLFLDESRAETGPTTARDGSGGGQEGNALSVRQSNSRQTGYHGSRVDGLTELRPGERGPMGPATYISPNSGVAGRYGATVYDVDVPDGVFHGMGAMGDNNVRPFERWTEQIERLASANPERATEIKAIAERLGPQDGYPFFRSLAQIFGSDEAAQAALQRAGFTGISGHIDGPEIAMFGNVPVRRLPDGGPLQRALRDRMQRE